MLEVRQIEDYDEIKNNLYEERLNESDECKAILNYVIDAGLFLDEDVNVVLKDLDYKIEDIDNWIMLRLFLERLKMEYSVNDPWNYIEEFKANNNLKGTCNKYTDNAKILFEGTESGQVVIFRKGRRVTVLEIYYPYQ